MPIVLDSDFTDYYDHALAGHGSSDDIRLVRRSDRTPTRRLSLEVLASCHSRFGSRIVEVADGQPEKERFFVAHDSIRRGEGGHRIVDGRELATLDPSFATVLLDTRTSNCMTPGHGRHNSWAIRCYQIGMQSIFTERWTDHGELPSGENENVIHRSRHAPISMEQVVHATIYTRDYVNVQLEFDFSPVCTWTGIHMAPRLADTEIEATLTPSEVADLIVEWWDFWKERERRMQRERARFNADIYRYTTQGGDLHGLPVSPWTAASSVSPSITIRNSWQPSGLPTSIQWRDFARSLVDSQRVAPPPPPPPPPSDLGFTAQNAYEYYSRISGTRAQYESERADTEGAEASEA